MAEIHYDKGAILHTPSEDELKLQFIVSAFDVFGVFIDNALKDASSEDKKLLTSYKKAYTKIQDRIKNDYKNSDTKAEILSLDELEKRDRVRLETLEAQNL